MQQEYPIRVAGGTLGRERHICALFNNRDEEHRVLRSFITEGLDRGEKAIHVVGPEQRQHHVARLREGGIDAMLAFAEGLLNPFFVPPDQFLLELRERGVVAQGTRRPH
jgi:MEDS: MEthanogen/methylotroph, DcmR Sensory domain